MNDEPMRSRIGDLANRLEVLGRDAVDAYTPVVDGLIRSGSRDTKEIERTLDGLLGFCGNEAALLLYRRLCRHFSRIDPAATVEYIRTYREMWGSDASTEASE